MYALNVYGDWVNCTIYMRFSLSLWERYIHSEKKYGHLLYIYLWALFYQSLILSLRVDIAFFLDEFDCICLPFSLRTFRRSGDVFEGVTTRDGGDVLLPSPGEPSGVLLSMMWCTEQSSTTTNYSTQMSTVSGLKNPDWELHFFIPSCPLPCIYDSGNMNKTDGLWKIPRTAYRIRRDWNPLNVQAGWRVCALTLQFWVAKRSEPVHLLCLTFYSIVISHSNCGVLCCRKSHSCFDWALFH